LGVQYPAASWGTIIEAAADETVLRSGYWNQWIPAGVCIVLAVLGFNFIGDGLRDAFDPKMKR
jgi:peptide/nickel transport system permease protein